MAEMWSPILPIESLILAMSHDYQNQFDQGRTRAPHVFMMGGFSLGVSQEVIWLERKSR